jgi:hypothetical protein
MNVLLFRILLLVVTMLSPAVKVTLTGLINQLDADAKKTDNPWDDIFVAMLRTLVLGE